MRLELRELDLPGVEVDSGDAVHVEARVVLVVKEIAHRVADRGLLEEAGGDLVQERLERVVVVLVDEHDVDVALLQPVSRSDAREAAAEDEHPGSRAVRVGAIAHLTPRVGPRVVRPLTPTG